MKIPILEAGKISMIRAESATGTLLNNNNEYYLNGSKEDYYLVFDSILEAKNYINILKKEQKFLIEYTLFSCEGKFLEIIH